MSIEKQPQSLEQLIGRERLKRLDEELEGFYTGGQFVIRVDPSLFNLIVEKVRAGVKDMDVEFMEIDFRGADSEVIEKMVEQSEAKRRELMIASHKERERIQKQRLLVISVPPDIHHTMGNELVKLVRTIPGVLAIQPKSITHREYNNLSHEFLGNIGIETSV